MGNGGGTEAKRSRRVCSSQRVRPGDAPPFKWHLSRRQRRASDEVREEAAQKDGPSQRDRAGVVGWDAERSRRVHPALPVPRSGGPAETRRQSHGPASQGASLSTPPPSRLATRHSRAPPTPRRVPSGAPAAPATARRHRHCSATARSAPHRLGSGCSSGCATRSSRDEMTPSLSAHASQRHHRRCRSPPQAAG